MEQLASWFTSLWLPCHQCVLTHAGNSPLHTSMSHDHLPLQDTTHNTGWCSICSPPYTHRSSKYTTYLYLYDHTYSKRKPRILASTSYTGRYIHSEVRNVIISKLSVTIVKEYLKANGPDR